MDSPPTIVLELHQWSPPLYRVVAVDGNLISEENLKVDEILTDKDLDYILDVFGDFGVEVKYPRK
jgi:hypothetical protein